MHLFFSLSLKKARKFFPGVDAKYLTVAERCFFRSGLCKLWSVPDCRPVRTYRGHNAQAGCARFHPEAYTTMDAGVLNVASCGHDGSVLLWSLDRCVRFSKILMTPRFSVTNPSDNWRVTARAFLVWHSIRLVASWPLAGSTGSPFFN